MRASRNCESRCATSWRSRDIMEFSQVPGVSMLASWKRVSGRKVSRALSGATGTNQCQQMVISPPSRCHWSGRLKLS